MIVVIRYDVVRSEVFYLNNSLRTARSAGENIDIYIGGVLCGTGEIVVIENSLGVRITDFRDDTV